MSFARIAEELNTRQVPTRTGARWLTTTVKNILTRKQKDDQKCVEPRRIRKSHTRGWKMAVYYGAKRREDHKFRRAQMLGRQ